MPPGILIIKFLGKEKSREYGVKEGKIEIVVITVIIIMLMTRGHELPDLKTSQRTIKIRLKKLHRAL